MKATKVTYYEKVITAYEALLMVDDEGEETLFVDQEKGEQVEVTDRFVEDEDGQPVDFDDDVSIESMDEAPFKWQYSWKKHASADAINKALEGGQW